MFSPHLIGLIDLGGDDRGDMPFHAVNDVGLDSTGSCWRHDGVCGAG